MGEAENIFKKALSATTIGIYPVWSKEENMLCISYENSDDNKDIYCILAQGFISEAYLLDKYQVSPAEFIDVKALMGDTADNIPGVPSVGEKTATKLIVEYGSVENIYENIEEVKPPRIKNLLIEHKDIAVLSKELATINIDSPIDIDIESADINTMFNSDAYSYM